MKLFNKTILLLAAMTLLPLATFAFPFVTTPSPSTYPIHWYQLKVNGMYIYGAPGWECAASSTPQTTDAYLWCFVQMSSNKVVVYNKAQQLYMCNGFELSTSDTSGTMDYVEEGSGSNFYIYFKLGSSKMYLTYDPDNGLCGYGWKSDAFSAIEVMVEEGHQITEEPTITMDTFETYCSISATGDGEVHLYKEGIEVDNPHTIYRTSEDQTVTFSATAQEPGKEMSEVSMQFTIPKQETPGDNAEITLSPYNFNIPHNTLSNYGEEGYAKLFDKDPSTKWCVVNSTGRWETITVDVMSNVAFIPTGYIMTTGNDTNGFPSRNPKAWKIYGKAKSSDSWTVIADVTNGEAAGLGTESATDYSFKIANVTQKYKLFRFEVSEVCGVDDWDPNNYVFQLSELQLTGITGMPGDVNDSGSVDGIDLNILINIILGKDSAANYNGRADIDRNGSVNGTDLNALINILLGK